MSKFVRREAQPNRVLRDQCNSLPLLVWSVTEPTLDLEARSNRQLAYSPPGRLREPGRDTEFPSSRPGGGVIGQNLGLGERGRIDSPNFLAGKGCYPVG